MLGFYEYLPLFPPFTHLASWLVDWALCLLSWKHTLFRLCGSYLSYLKDLRLCLRLLLLCHDISSEYREQVLISARLTFLDEQSLFLRFRQFIILPNISAFRMLERIFKAKYIFCSFFFTLYLWLTFLLPACYLSISAPYIMDAGWVSQGGVGIWAL